MKNILTIAVAAMIFGAVACNKSQTMENSEPEFVTVRDGEFFIGDSVYRYVGTNFWYGAILGAERQGDRARLAAELDSLKALGITNLRVLAGGQGDRHMASHIEPTLQKAPGVYDQDLLEGLDYFIAELEKRDMKAVIYLNNAWEWSGGYGTYLEWAGEGQAPVPAETSYPEFMNFVKNFVTNDSAKALFAQHVDSIVGRTNTVTGQPYSQSTAIMSWQIANEPRAFDPANLPALEQWLTSTAAQIKAIDSNHLVSTGSEGSWGCENDLEVWTRIHSDANIDYANIHIWPYNWSWVSPDSLMETLPAGCDSTLRYITEHYNAINPKGKPIVLEEFGFPRDSMAIAQGTPTEARDKYYSFVFDIIANSGMIKGANFWGWGGLAVPNHRTWQPGDPYTGDPAQEDQGLNSVYISDRSTLGIIQNAIANIKK